ncbi:MAG: LysR family transcriptional regulator [Mariprofundaceae bacterium]|nr:LysR family transcriptional regulator [Mariprofundaceae bacterium]
MTLEQLRVFCAIVEQGGFRAAGDKLYKSQASISIALKKLEEELGLSLFHRDSYRPQLTEHGAALYKKALAILQRSAEFVHLAEHFSVGEESELRLAISGITPIEIILGVLQHTSQQSPSTQLSLQIENLNGTMERLYDGDADIAITEHNNHDTDFESQHLTRIQLIAVLAPSSPLAERAAILSEADIEGLTQIIVRDTSLHSAKVTAGVIAGSNRWVVNDFMMKKQIIASGSGWGRMPLHMVQEDVRQGRLIAISSTHFPPISVEIKALRHKHKPIGPTAAALWQRLQRIDWQATAGQSL